MSERPDLTGHWVGFVCVGQLVLAYLLVMAEDFTQLRNPGRRSPGPV